MARTLSHGGIMRRREATERAGMRGARRGLRILVAAALALAPGLVACSDAETPSPPQASRAASVVPVPKATQPRDVAVFEVAELGTIRVELLEDVSPRSVEKFRSLVREGYYDGTTFHRVIPGFVVQGGDPRSRDRDPRNDGFGGTEEQMTVETSELSFTRGILAFANSGRETSSGPQFFITLEHNPGLDGRYAVLGHVVEGYEVVDAISRVSVDMYGRHGPQDRPLEDVVIEDLRIEEDAGGTARMADGTAPAGAARASAGAEGSAEGGDDGAMAASDWSEGTP